MNVETTFLTVDVILSIHHRLIAEFGGGDGIRDHGLLEAAAAMPRQRFDGTYLHSTLAEQAAAYLYHLCCNHAFIDGNKRTALATAEFFLLLNDRQLIANNEELYEITMGVAKGTVDKRALTDFFRSHVK